MNGCTSISFIKISPREIQTIQMLQQKKELIISVQEKLRHQVINQTIGLNRSSSSNNSNFHIMTVPPFLSDEANGEISDKDNISLLANQTLDSCLKALS
jgi:hypothetical protein